MKTLVFKLGLTTLAVLPIVAVASCSSTTPEVPTIDSEVKNFEKKLDAKTTAQSITTREAITTLNGSGDAQSKWTYLSTLVELPKENSNFTYEVQSAATATDSKTSIVVTIKISEKANPSNTKMAQLTISKLTQKDSALETEAKRFEISSPANTESAKLETSVVIEEINKASEGAKLVKLQEYTTVPSPSQGFSIKVISAQVGSQPSSVDVKISVTEDSTAQAIEVIFSVTGFKVLTPQEKFDSQLALIVNQQVLDPKKGETATQAKAIITKANFNEYYKPISLLYGVTYEYLSSEVNTATNTTLDVTLTIKSNVQGVADATKKVSITGFISPEAAMKTELAKLSNKNVLAGKASETAAQAGSAINANTLGAYYAPVTLSKGFSYAWVSNQVVGDTVKVTVKVSSTDAGITAVDHPIIISGFNTLLDIEAAKFAVSKSTNNGHTPTRVVIQQINAASSQADKLAKLKSFINASDFPALSEGFTLEVGPASNGNFSNAVNVALKIIEKSTKKEKTVTFTIVGLAIEV